MSMPTFPEKNPDITCEYALNMVLASIAMEELALSHIMNAEGEKLQYVLGTLETSSGKKPTIEEVLSVNQSITGLLESVSQNQIILKNKMDKTIQALSDVSQKPSCKCPGKCSAAFQSIGTCQLWHAGTALCWDTEQIDGGCAYHESCDKTKIVMPAKGRFVVSFAVNVRAKQNCNCKVAISLQLENKRQRMDLYTVHSHVPHANATVTVSMGGILVDTSHYPNPPSLLLKLVSSDSLVAEDSLLSIMEI